MYRILIEDEGAYHFCRKGRFDKKEVVWHVASPWLLVKLQKLGEKVVSLEKNVSSERQLIIGRMSLQFGEEVSKVIEIMLRDVSLGYSLGRALKHQVQWTFFTLNYKAMLLNEWRKSYINDKLIVVGDKQLEPVVSFNISYGRFDNLFSSIVDANDIDGINNFHYVQKNGSDILDQISRKENMSTNEKILYSINNMTLLEFFHKQVKKKVKPLRNINLWFESMAEYDHDIVALKNCPLIDEAIPHLLKRGVNVKFVDHNSMFFHSEPIDLQFKPYEIEISLKKIVNSIYKEKNIFVDGIIRIVASRLYKAIQYGIGLSYDLDAIYEKFINCKSKKFSVITNGLCSPSERLLQQCFHNNKVPVFSFEHGVTAGIDGMVTPNYFEKNLYTDGEDFMICYNEHSFKAMNKSRPVEKGIYAGCPKINRTIKYHVIQRILTRRYIRAKNNSRVVMFLALLSRNNHMEPPLQVNDLEYFDNTNRMVFKVLAKLEDQCILKLYPSNRYLDPDPFYGLINMPSNVEAIQYYEFSELRAAADVIILSSTQSVFGWAFSTQKPIIFLELPSKPIMRNVIDLFSQALFLIDGSKEGWEEKIVDLLKLPHNDLLGFWQQKKESREKLDRYIFGPKGNAGKRASDYIFSKI